ncbi:MAG: FkbM family methyltransferase [Bradyrhizobium sp.]|nr:FkbM family methyltransferase [Bradyrhizobium sp.]
MHLPFWAVSAISSHWPFANGSGRFIDKFGKGISLGGGIRTCHTSDGFELDVLESDHIGRHILFSGKFDRTPVQVLLDFGQTGDAILDVGANIGYVSCCLLQNIAESSIVSIEPQPEIVDLLRTNLARFPKERSRVVEAALSDKHGVLELAIDPINRGASSVHGSPSAQLVQIQAVSAEQLLGDMARLDLMKMDVEGHEEHVFRSAERQLGSLQPRAIQFEDREGKAAPSGEIGAILGRIGYRTYGIRKDLFTTTLVLIENAADCRFNDYVAVSTRRDLPAAASRKYRLA